MVFSSITFLFLFLPGFLCLYALMSLPQRVSGAICWKRLRNLGILVASLLFYAWGEKLFVLVMMYSTALDYFLGLVIAEGIGSGRRTPLERLPRGGPRTAVQRTALGMSIAGNLLVLAIFKYFNFFVDSFNSVAGSIGLTGVIWEDAIHIALPIGISFYTFQSMSYTIDVYRGEVKATRSFIDFACFVTMFPQLVAGPIVRFKDICNQLVNRHVTSDSFALGVRRFIVGLGKKVLIANVVAGPADRIFALPGDQLTFAVAWFGVLCYGIQIYFDFSGYSDMAIGLGRMLGFTFPENFNYPYVSQSIREFWRRWHISLSAWFRDYLYISLGGGRVSRLRVHSNLVVVFFLCGLWHGASWTFVCWGLFHGAFLVAERAGLERIVSATWRPLRHLYVLVVVGLGWVLFRAETFPHAWDFLVAMSGLGAAGAAAAPWGRIATPEVVTAVVLGLLGSAPAVPVAAGWLGERVAALAERGRRLTERGVAVARLSLLVAVFVLAVAWLASGTYNPFIYFRF